jgi:hypothetical protein
MKPGVGSARGAALVEVFRTSLAALESLDPAEQDAIVAALVDDLRVRRPASVAPFGELRPPTEPISDLRVPRRPTGAAVTEPIGAPRGPRGGR